MSRAGSVSSWHRTCRRSGPGNAPRSASRTTTSGVYPAASRVSAATESIDRHRKPVLYSAASFATASGVSFETTPITVTPFDRTPLRVCSAVRRSPARHRALERQKRNHNHSCPFGRTERSACRRPRASAGRSTLAGGGSAGVQRRGQTAPDRERQGECDEPGGMRATGFLPLTDFRRFHRVLSC